MISATTKVILATEEVTTATLKVISESVHYTQRAQNDTHLKKNLSNLNFLSLTFTQ